VTVDGSGELTGLHLSERTRNQPATRTAEQIVATLRSARTSLLATLTDALGAYGVLCGFVPAALDALQRILTEGIGSAQHSVDDSARRLRTSARTYEHTDGTAEAPVDPWSGCGSPRTSASSTKASPTAAGWTWPWAGSAPLSTAWP